MGARTTLSRDKSIKLIEDIITCVNVYNLYRKNNNREAIRRNQYSYANNLYLESYSELTSYLRYLFIYYNSLISDKELENVDVPFIKFLKNELEKKEEIIIITYNYDIWLERLLLLHNIKFNIEGFEGEIDSKVKIIKPHGSISFSHVAKQEEFQIAKDSVEGVLQEVTHFEIKYNFEEDFPIVNALIPPAGDANRSKRGWIKVLREKINDKLSLSKDTDKLIIFGISYWHVDRMEIDEILTKINPFVDVTLINPSPPTTLDAVLTSLFKSYTHFTYSDLLLKEKKDNPTLQENNVLEYT